MNKQEPLFDAEDCEECGTSAEEMEWDEDQESYLCPGCGGKQ